MATKRAADSEEGGPPPAKRSASDSGAGAGAGSGESNGSSYGKPEFLAAFKELSEEVLSVLKPEYEMPDEAIAWIKEMTEYTVPGGKLNRGLTVVHCLQSILGRALTKDEESKAATLGWCVEWLQACFLVADDLMDDSITRRGGPCWYRLPKVGTTAVNDSFILKSSIYVLIKRHFKGEPYYTQLVDLFREVTFQTELGQLLDLTSQERNAPIDLTRFTKERYHSIVKYKTAFYSFYLPVALAMILGGITADAAFDEARDILVEMGEYFQIQDDYLDCYGDEATIGKIGTDIQDNKCSWLVVQAMDRASEAQLAVLKARYGRDTPEDIAAVKALYAELGLDKVFEAYENASYASLRSKIDSAKHTPKGAFEGLLAKIYKRKA